MLREHGIEVLEVNRPDRAKRRLQGKSDPTDTENAARSVLSGETTSVPKTHSGAAEAMRVISVARRSAVKAKTQAINQLRAMLVSAPQDIRERLWKANPEQCIAGCAHLRTLGTSVLLQTLATTLRLLAKRWLMLAAELKKLDAALAALCGVSPLQASSGKTIRHRLNRGGDRSANNALWTIAMVRMRSDPRTRAYVQRRSADGMSNKEIRRCLKRYIVRELYPFIIAGLGAKISIS